LAVDIENRDLYFLGKFYNDIERGFPKSTKNRLTEPDMEEEDDFTD
jgi:hypothetical protein